MSDRHKRPSGNGPSEAVRSGPPGVGGQLHRREFGKKLSLRCAGSARRTGWAITGQSSGGSRPNRISENETKEDMVSANPAKAHPSPEPQEQPKGGWIDGGEEDDADDHYHRPLRCGLRKRREGGDWAMQEGLCLRDLDAAIAVVSTNCGTATGAVPLSGAWIVTWKRTVPAARCLGIDAPITNTPAGFGGTGSCLDVCALGGRLGA